MRRQSLGVVLLAAIAVVVPTAATYALFGDTASASAGVVVTGDLALAESGAGPIRWQETTAAVPAGSRASGADFTSLAAFRGVPGDTVEVRYRVLTTLVGDNISAVLRAALAPGADPLPAGLALTGYRILTEGGVVLAPASGFTAMGAETRLAGLTVAGEQTLVVSVQLAWTGTAAAIAYTTDIETPDPPALAGIPLRISLEQVRDGAGFVP